MQLNHLDHDALDAPHLAPPMDDVTWQRSLAAAPKIALTVLGLGSDSVASLRNDAAGHS
jgi:hypothetical protein